MTYQLPQKLGVCLTLILLGCGPSAATASLIRDAKDRNATIELFGNIGSGDGATAQITEGTIKVKAVKGKHGAAEFKVEPGSSAGSWSFGRELRIGVSPEKVGELSVFLAVIAEKTRAKPDYATRWQGRYVLKITGPKGESEIKGRLKSCEAS